MAKRAKKSSGIFQSGFALSLIVFVVLAVGYFFYSEHQKGVLGTSTQTTSTNANCSHWVKKITVYGYLISKKAYTKADVICQDNKSFPGLIYNYGRSIGAWGDSAQKWCENYSNCRSTSNPPLP